MMSKSMSASAGPTTPGAHLIPMLMSPEDKKEKHVRTDQNTFRHNKLNMSNIVNVQN